MKIDAPGPILLSTRSVRSEIRFFFNGALRISLVLASLAFGLRFALNCSRAAPTLRPVDGRTEHWNLTWRELVSDPSVPASPDLLAIYIEATGEKPSLTRIKRLDDGRCLAVRAKAVTPIDSKHKEFPASLAESLHKLWVRELLLTQYPRQRDEAWLDGTFCVLGCKSERQPYYLMGCFHYPQSRELKWSIDIGRLIANFVESADPKQDSRLIQFIQKLVALELARKR